MKKILTFALVFTVALTPVLISNLPVTTITAEAKAKKKKPKYTAKQFRRLGVIRYKGYRWTWYSQRVLPGRGLKIPGRHVDKNGYVCDQKNRIVLASRNLKKGTVIKTPFGKKGKVYDYCPISGTMDVYVNW